MKKMIRRFAKRIDEDGDYAQKVIQTIIAVIAVGIMTYSVWTVRDSVHGAPWWLARYKWTSAVWADHYARSICKLGMVIFGLNALAIIPVIMVRGHLKEMLSLTRATKISHAFIILYTRADLVKDLLPDHWDKNPEALKNLRDLPNSEMVKTNVQMDPLDRSKPYWHIVFGDTMETGVPAAPTKNPLAYRIVIGAARIEMRWQITRALDKR